VLSNFYYLLLYFFITKMDKLEQLENLYYLLYLREMIFLILSFDFSTSSYVKITKRKIIFIKLYFILLFAISALII
jgi:hypothetical protein